MSKHFLVPTLDESTTDKVIDQLQLALSALNDWSLTLKHAHWNVAGPNFIAIHEMLDPQIDKVREAADSIGERIATLGGSPDGRSVRIAQDQAKAQIKWGTYPIVDRKDAIEHLKVLDEFVGVLIEGFRDAIAKVDPLDIVSSNILQDISQQLEFDQWFYRSHLI
ncbi:MAG: DNA starvation/stationary phase protection protein [Bifidobacteriaceae bacterium]|jgi:starvation-inducible DNA-binding protein|nr:DNA starvation/stationary phase protection protein [Bifidobacteriaceae bacterium]